jgi:hypothetical protein
MKKLFWPFVMSLVFLSWFRSSVGKVWFDGVVRSPFLLLLDLFAGVFWFKDLVFICHVSALPSCFHAAGFSSSSSCWVQSGLCLRWFWLSRVRAEHGRLVLRFAMCSRWDEAAGQICFLSCSVFLPPVGPQVHARHFRGAPCFPLLIFRPAFLLCSLLVFLRQLQPLGAGSLAAPEWLPSLEFCFPAAVFTALSGLASRVYSAPGPTSWFGFHQHSPALGFLS